MPIIDGNTRRNIKMVRVGVPRVRRELPVRAWLAKTRNRPINPFWLKDFSKST